MWTLRDTIYQKIKTNDLSLSVLGTWRDELVPLEQLELRGPQPQPHNPGSPDLPHLTGTPRYLVPSYFKSFLTLGMNRISNLSKIRPRGYGNRPRYQIGQKADTRFLAKYPIKSYILTYIRLGYWFRSIPITFVCFVYQDGYFLMQDNSQIFLCIFSDTVFICFNAMYRIVRRIDHISALSLASTKSNWRPIGKVNVQIMCMGDRQTERDRYTEKET